MNEQEKEHFKNEDLALFLLMEQCDKNDIVSRKDVMDILDSDCNHTTPEPQND